MPRKIDLIRGRESGALRRRLKEIQADLDPRSAKMDRFRTKLKKVIVEDNEDKLTHYGGNAYAGVDRFGRDLKQPAESTLKGRKGALYGFVLAPNGLASRTITCFRVKWEYSGKQWRAMIGWVGIPWLIYHLQGCRKGSKGVDKKGRDMANWSLPKRDIGGITPKGMVRVREAFVWLKGTIVKAG